MISSISKVVTAGKKTFYKWIPTIGTLFISFKGIFIFKWIRWDFVSVDLDYYHNGKLSIL